MKGRPSALSIHSNSASITSAGHAATLRSVAAREDTPRTVSKSPHAASGKVRNVSGGSQTTFSQKHGLTAPKVETRMGRTAACAAKDTISSEAKVSTSFLAQRRARGFVWWISSFSRMSRIRGILSSMPATANTESWAERSKTASGHAMNRRSTAAKRASSGAVGRLRQRKTAPASIMKAALTKEKGAPPRKR